MAEPVRLACWFAGTTALLPLRPFACSGATTLACHAGHGWGLAGPGRKRRSAGFFGPHTSAWTSRQDAPLSAGPTETNLKTLQAFLHLPKNQSPAGAGLAAPFSGCGPERGRLSPGLSSPGGQAGAASPPCQHPPLLSELNKKTL